MRTIALALNIPELQTNFRDPSIGKKYPGAGFLPHLAKMADERGWAIAGVDHIDASKNVHLLQEEFNPRGLLHEKMGSIPKVLFCMESKLYAPIFYDALPQLKKMFQYQILFDGGTHQLKFPSYDRSEVKVKRIPWLNRKKEICMVASNKQWWYMPHDWSSPSYCSAVRNELHSERLRAIEKNPNLDLYGNGWNNLDNLPPQWAHLRPVIQKAWKGPIEDKVGTLSQYKWNICHENTFEPGYVTEKLPQCRLAGCASIYIGGGGQVPVVDLEKGDYSNEVFAELVMELMES